MVPSTPTPSVCFRFNSLPPSPNRVRNSGSRRAGRQPKLVRQQDMQALQVEGQTHQTPFAGGGHQAAQRELTEASTSLMMPITGSTVDLRIR